MELTLPDWAIIVAFFAVSLGIGIALRKRAGESYVQFFASGRSLPWWIAGTSMVATTFAADTPLWVTEKVAQHGLAGNWFWWAFALGGMLTAFVYAKLWRRSEVLTDVELIELRYTGRPAAVLRVFRALYVATIVNAIVIGWVTQAIVKILRHTVLIDLPEDSATDFWLVMGLLALTAGYSALSGLWGVAITDLLQFVLAMGGCIALAVLAVDHVGGTDALREQAVARFGSDHLFDYIPDFTAADAWLPLGVFLAMALGQWWATWYPGAEPGGGGYVVQRMASCKDERHAVKATLYFQLVHYCVRPWPWILVAYCAVVRYPDLRTAADPGTGYPRLMADLAPVGLRGLLIVTFFAAFMSTISTQTNWGASYLVNDVWRRLAPDAETGQRRLVSVSRAATVVVTLLGGAAAWLMIRAGVTVGDAWAFLAALGAGVGPVFLLRWFWWRINAWSEITAMVASVVVFTLVKLFPPDLHELYTSLLVASTSLVLWVAVTLFTRPEPLPHLAAFYRKVRPDGPGWRPVAAAATEVRPDGTLGPSLLCAVLGTAAIWLTLPGIGAVIFGEWGSAAACLSAAVLAIAAVLAMLPRLQPRG